MTALGIEADALVFEHGPRSGVGHNDQFDLDRGAALVALARLGAFLDRYQRPCQEHGDLAP